MDRYDLYDLCVTEPGRLVRFVRAAHGRSPRALREDFAGTAALARAWVRAVRGGSAVAVDRDPEPLAKAAGVARLEAVVADVMTCRARADVVTATNFALGYLHTREALLAYLAHARRCLLPGGVLVADLYGGASAAQPGRYTRSLEGPGGEAIAYTFEQRSASPITGHVVDALHFRVRAPGERRARVLRDAFVYEWRLWGLPELRDALREAGFSAIEVHDRVGEAVDARGRLHLRPLGDGDALEPDWLVYLVARR